MPIKPNSSFCIGMNRHHFAVYLRHCKLELLLRREAENAVAEFRAAEWRWETPTVCDGNWHSYVSGLIISYSSYNFLF